MVTVTNTLAYYGWDLTTAVKRFVVDALLVFLELFFFVTDSEVNLFVARKFFRLVYYF